MIPKVIHYCWFGRNPKSEIIQKCIDSWHEYCPDYEIVEWNEDNFDVNAIPYTRDAYAAKKWAFVSDYARLKVVYDYGGIYLDTDVLLHNNLDELLQYDCWLASDDVRYMATGMGFGAVCSNHLIKEIMLAYSDYEYPSGTNVTRDTTIIERELPEWKKSNRSQVLRDSILLMGMDDYGKYARHLYTCTWGEPEKAAEREKELLQGKPTSKKMRFVWKIKCAARNPKLIAFFDKRKGTKIERIYTFLAYDFLDLGPNYWLKRLLKRYFS